MRPLDELAIRACRGDAAAFDLLIDALATPLLRYVSGVMGGDVHGAHDVVQETFLLAWRGVEAIQVPEQFRAWIFRVAHRRAVSWLRRRGPHGTPFVGLDEVFASGDVTRRIDLARRGGAAPPDSSDAPYDRRASRVADGPAPRLRAVLGDMPSIYAAPLTLYYLESIGLSETALVLNVPLSTLKMRLYRGRRMLRRRLLAAEPWPPPCPAQATRPSKATGPSSTARPLRRLDTTLPIPRPDLPPANSRRTLP